MAASNATRALFARLQQRTALLKSISLLDCLLAAHAALVSTSESLGASMGHAGGPETQQGLQVCAWLADYLSVRLCLHKDELLRCFKELSAEFHHGLEGHQTTGLEELANDTLVTHMGYNQVKYMSGLVSS